MDDNGYSARFNEFPLSMEVRDDADLVRGSAAGPATALHGMADHAYQFGSREVLLRRGKPEVREDVPPTTTASVLWPEDGAPGYLFPTLLADAVAGFSIAYSSFPVLAVVVRLAHHWCCKSPPLSEMHHTCGMRSTEERSFGVPPNRSTPREFTSGRARAKL